MMKTKTLPQLVKDADTAFSRYIRIRDSELRGGDWRANCITCERDMCVVSADGRWNAGVNAGHFVGRSAKSVRWNEENVNAQCAHCNAWRDKIDMLDRYRRALDFKYGDGTAERLVIEGKQLKKPSRPELEEIIKDSKEQVKWYLNGQSAYNRPH